MIVFILAFCAGLLFGIICGLSKPAADNDNN